MPRAPLRAALAAGAYRCIHMPLVCAIPRQVPGAAHKAMVSTSKSPHCVQMTILQGGAAQEDASLTNVHLENHAT